MSLNCFNCAGYGNKKQLLPVSSITRKLPRKSSKKHRICFTKPIKQLLTIPDLFDNKLDPSEPNILKLKKHLIGEGRLDSHLVMQIIHMATKLLKSEPNVLNIMSPVNLVGDIHGQFYDLLTILKVK